MKSAQRGWGWRELGFGCMVLDLRGGRGGFIFKAFSPSPAGRYCEHHVNGGSTGIQRVGSWAIPRAQDNCRAPSLLFVLSRRLTGFGGGFKRSNYSNGNRIAPDCAVLAGGGGGVCRGWMEDTGLPSGMRGASLARGSMAIPLRGRM